MKKTSGMWRCGAESHTVFDGIVLHEVLCLGTSKKQFKIVLKLTDTRCDVSLFTQCPLLMENIFRICLIVGAIALFEKNGIMQLSLNEIAFDKRQYMLRLVWAYRVS